MSHRTHTGAAETRRGRWHRAVVPMLALCLLTVGCAPKDSSSDSPRVAAAASQAAASATPSSSASPSRVDPPSAPVPGGSITVAPAGGNPASGPQTSASDTGTVTPPTSTTTRKPTPTPTPQPKPKPTQKPQPKPATVTASPAFGSTDVGPLQPLTVTAAGGKLEKLTVLAEDGSAIAGSMSADRKTWTSDQRLRYGGSYTASGSASGQAGSAATEIAGRWTVFGVSDTVSTRITPRQGEVVGVAAPVIVSFGYYAADTAAKAEIQRNARITTTPKVEGAWAWFKHDGEPYESLDWRPKEFWPAGTKVHVEVDLLGVLFADGLYGGRDVATRDFTIGRNQVVRADPGSKIVTVERSGKITARYPTSMGRGDEVGDPRLVTRSGIHIVLAKFKTTKMSNPDYGYRDLVEKWAVRISNNGEYIHQNMASFEQQGKKNVSHGCLNLSDVNAQAYFKTAIYGDPVVITGTSVKLGPDDGDYYGWAMSWKDWLSHSAR